MSRSAIIPLKLMCDVPGPALARIHLVVDRDGDIEDIERDGELVSVEEYAQYYLVFTALISRDWLATKAKEILAPFEADNVKEFRAEKQYDDMIDIELEGA